MYKFLNSGADIDPLDVLKEIANHPSYYIQDSTIECPWCEEEIHDSSIDVSEIEMVIDKIEIQRLNNA